MKKKIESKLALNKSTVVNLDDDKMKKLNGGGTTSEFDCIGTSNCHPTEGEPGQTQLHCYSWWPNQCPTAAIDCN